MFPEDDFKNFAETRSGIDRTIMEHGFETPEEFLNYCEANNIRLICDLGSGTGGFAKDMYVYSKLYGLDLTVFSINPRYNKDTVELRDYEAEQDQRNLEFWEKSKRIRTWIEEGRIYGIEDLKVLIKQAARKYKDTSKADTGDNLSFENDYFDLVISTGAYLFYKESFTPETLNEIMRTIRSGGEFRASFNVSIKKDLDFYYEVVSSIREMGYQVDLQFDQDVSNADEFFSKQLNQALGRIIIKK
jgi:SAM-dependent methyltransferase